MLKEGDVDKLSQPRRSARFDQRLFLNGAEKTVHEAIGQSEPPPSEISDLQYLLATEVAYQGSDQGFRPPQSGLIVDRSYLAMAHGLWRDRILP